MARTRRIYLNKACDVFCVVDEKDYAWASQWRWSFTLDRTRKKKYATRNTRRRGETTKQIKVYLHKEILLRSGKPQPTDKHTIGDHEDGDSLNNTRGNLDWATRSMNNRNRFGVRAKQRRLEPQQAADEIPF